MSNKLQRFHRLAAVEAIVGVKRSKIKEMESQFTKHLKQAFNLDEE